MGSSRPCWGSSAATAATAEIAVAVAAEATAAVCISGGSRAAETGANSAVNGAG